MAPEWLVAVLPGNWPIVRCSKIAFCACGGNAGKVFSATSRTNCFLWRRWRGKCSRQRNSQFYASDKRPMTSEDWKSLDYLYLPTSTSILTRKCLNNAGHRPQTHGNCIQCDAVITRLLPEASFGLRVLSLPASVCLCVCPSVRQSRACPRDNSSPFQLGSPNLDHRCKRLRFLLFWGVIDLDLQGQI